MGVYHTDKSSPKKGGLHRTGFSEVRRRLTSRRYLCLWVLVALVPCYLLRQIFFYQSPATAAAYARHPTEEHLTTSGKMLPYEKPTEVEPVKQKSVLDLIFKPTTIKPAQYTTGGSTTTQSGENVTRNSLKLRLKENFEDDDDFGVAEDNDKAEEQMWTAPPAPIKPKAKTSLER